MFPPRFFGGASPRLPAVILAACVGGGADLARAQGPVIDVWHGLNQSFGAHGHPQRYANVLGRVTDTDGVLSLTARLNGGSPRNLTIGPDGRRLQSAGDFNVDITRSSLLNGSNSLLLTATDTLNNVSTATIAIQYFANSAWPRTWTTAWASQATISDGAQVGDGLWHIDPQGARLTNLGYDRTLMIGDEITWASFEVLVPITIHGFDPAGFLGTAVAPAFGITNRWQGHTERILNEQPYSGWTQQGGGPWYEYSQTSSPRMSLMGFHGMQIDRFLTIPLGVKQWWKVRSETLPNGDTFYGFKYWPDGSPEPLAWTMNGTENPDDLQRGSLLFIAHYVDVSIGDVQVTALQDETVPPANFDLAWQIGSTHARAVWTSTEPTSFELAYGLTAALELGTVHGSDPIVRHAAVLSELTPNQVYHYEIRGRDARGFAAPPLTGTFTTASITPTHPSGADSDDFSGSQLDPSIWNFVDPRNDARAALNGHQLEIEVPAGQTHAAWYDTGGNQMPRVLQNVLDIDFEIEAKFDSPIDMISKSQGIVVEQDANNFLRFDFLSTNLGTRIWVGGVRNGFRPYVYEQRLQALISPQWMRVWREGSVWTVWFSFDGVLWTNAVVFDHSMTVQRVGVSAGNVQGTAHTAEVDYFAVTLCPIDPEDGEPSKLVTQTYGHGAITRSPEQQSYASNVQVTLTATPQAGWFFDGWGGDYAGLHNPLEVTTTCDARLAIARFSLGPDRIAPVFSQIQVERSANAAIITWRTDEPASTLLLYGPTTNYTSANEDPNLLMQHSATLQGLQPGQNYHYRIYASDGSGNESSTGDLTLRTTPAGNPFSIFSDDFAGSTLDADEWTFLDPNADSNCIFDAQRLSISVPAASTHDAWSQTNGNSLARVLQAAPDSDFEVEVRFESDVTADFQAQGLLFEQDGDNYLKVEITRTSGAKRLFAGTLRNGGTTTIHAFFPVALPTPVWMRVLRQGNQWTISTSGNGTSWTQQASFSQALQVTAAGVYAGNHLGTAHTAIFDYFFDTAHPIVPEDGNPSQLVVNTQGRGIVQRSPEQNHYAASESVELTAIPLSGWVFSHWAGNASGNANPIVVVAGTQPTVTAVFTVDATPPLITGVQALPASRRATLIWNTDEPASGQLDWGRTANYTGAVGSSVLQTAHVATIYGLSPGELIHYRVGATDAAANSTQTADAVFRTRAGFVSDDFAGAGLDRARWRLEDPSGNAVASLVNRRVEIAVPPSVVEPTSGPVRLVQELEYGDFVLEGRIDSGFSATRGQTAGLIAEADASNGISFGATWAGDHLRFVCERRAGGIRTRTEFPLTGQPIQLPMYLRLARQGDQWNLDHSFDHQIWISTFAFQATLSDLTAGLFVENRSAVSFTAQFDYVFELTEPVVPEDGAVSALVVNTIGPGYVLRTPDLPRYAAGQTIQIQAIPYAGAIFTGWEGAISGTTNPLSVSVGASTVLTARFHWE